MGSNPTLRVRAVDERIGTVWPRPGYATPGSAGIDLRACVDGPVTIPPGACELVGTGIAIDLDGRDVAGFLMPRSGLGHKHGLVLGNLVGLIDPDYQGEIKASCWNRNHHGDVHIQPGERIAQLVLVPVWRPDLHWVEGVNADTQRGAGGFGSTDIPGPAYDPDHRD